jgi:hypothetical protein
MRRIVTKKSATAKTQMSIGGYTSEKRNPSIDLFSQMILAAGLLIDDFCAILRLDVKKRSLPADLVKLAEIAISPVLGKGLAEFEVAFANP